MIPTHKPPYQGDPRIIKSKFTFRCFCGKKVEPGDLAVHFPQSQNAKCFDCGKYDYYAFQKQFQVSH
jgi:hypothetical protein